MKDQQISVQRNQTLEFMTSGGVFTLSQINMEYILFWHTCFYSAFAILNFIIILMTVKKNYDMSNRNTFANNQPQSLIKNLSKIEI